MIGMKNEALITVSLFIVIMSFVWVFNPVQAMQSWPDYHLGKLSTKSYCLFRCSFWDYLVFYLHPILLSLSGTLLSDTNMIFRIECLDNRWGVTDLPVAGERQAQLCHR